jgi:TolB-like protein/Tfp pilus assembly protein PilF
MSIWGELKRRKVVRVAGGYALIAWSSLQLTSVLSNLLDWPTWIGRAVVLIVVTGFPLTLTLAWLFDITSEGIVRDRQKLVSRFGVNIEYVLLGAILLFSGWLLYLLGFNEEGAGDMVEPTMAVGESVRDSNIEALHNSVAILPFENLSPDPDNAFFAAGLHEEVLHQIARIQDLRVISRRSVLRYADSDIGIPQIADELDVRFVMEGSARFAGDEVRIQSQLIDGQTDEHLWVDVYQRELTDIFSIQADIAQRIATELKTKFLPENRNQIELQSSKSPRALANYLHAISLNWGASDKDRALALLDDAIAEDPDFGSAIAFRALVNATSLNNTPGSVHDWRNRYLAIEQLARSDAERALGLDAGLGRAYVALARINQYRWKDSETRKAYEAGLRIAPSDVDLLRGFAWFNSVAGNHEYAIELAERAVRIDPMSAATHAELGQRQTFAGNWDAAYAAHAKAVSLDPDYGVHHLRMANNEIARGNLSNALTSLQTAEALIDTSEASPELLAELAYAFSRAGSTADAQRIVDEIESRSSDIHVGIGARAMSLLALGNYSKALVLLNESIVAVADDGIIDSSFKALAQISANVLADPELERAEYREARSQLTFRD